MKIKCKFKEIRKDDKNNSELTLIVNNYIDKELIKELKQDEDYAVEIKIARNKRSIQQNSLLWHNIQLIAESLDEDTMKVYCDLLERADALSEFLITATEMEDALRKSFRGVKFYRKQEVNGKECYVYKVYLGSSKMTVKEMNKLIDISLDVMAELDINEDYML